MSEIDTGHRVLLFRSRGWLRSPIGAAIAFQTRSEYCHAGILLPDWTCWEALFGKGICARRFSPGEFATVDPYRVESVTPEQWAKAEVWYRAQRGVKYDTLAILRFLNRRDMEENGRLFCSEYVFRGLLEAGTDPLLARIPASHVSPALLNLAPSMHYSLPITRSP